MGEMRKACSTLFRKSEGKRKLRNSLRRGEDNIKMNLKIEHEIRTEVLFLPTPIRN
jgi:hypothetical protein